MSFVNYTDLNLYTKCLMGLGKTSRIPGLTNYPHRKKSLDKKKDG